MPRKGTLGAAVCWHCSSSVIVAFVFLKIEINQKKKKKQKGMSKTVISAEVLTCFIIVKCMKVMSVLRQAVGNSFCLGEFA